MLSPLSISLHTYYGNILQMKERKKGKEREREREIKITDKNIINQTKRLYATPPPPPPPPPGTPQQHHNHTHIREREGEKRGRVGWREGEDQRREEREGKRR